MGNISGQYGVSFSPDNSKLYVSSDSRTIDPQFLDVILQYDLNAGDPGLIAASARSLIINNPKTNLPAGGVIEGWSTAEKGMALAMDGRLYISGNDVTQEIIQDDILVVIDKPNESVFDTDIYFKEFAFGNGRTGTGLPNFLQSYFNGLESISNCFEGSSVEIYPNPVEDQLQISFNSGCNVSFGLQVLNAIGQIVFSSHQEFKNSCTVDLFPLSAGVYFVLIDISNKKRLIRKIVKL